MNWHLLGYALACVTIPMAWGLMVVWISNRIERKLLNRRLNPGIQQGKSREETTLPPIEYHI